MPVTEPDQLRLLAVHAHPDDETITSGVTSRLKIMARFNISERRLPQDGRINFRSEGTVLDIRVSTIPTIYAESISLRLLNQKKEAYTMDRLGMSAEEQSQINHILDFPQHFAGTRVVTLERKQQGSVSKSVLIYLNRLSDLLFVLARVVNAEAGIEEMPWQQPPRQGR